MRCDVAIVGAGPGGSGAAYWLARHGVDVLLIDKAHFPRSKPCGEALTPQAMSILKRMGLDGIVERRGRAFAGLRLFTPDGQASLIDLPEKDDGLPLRGIVIPRYDLDDILRQQAVAAGCRFLSGYTATSVYYRRGQLAGIGGHHERHPLTIQARLIVLATGAIRVLPEKLGMSAPGSAGGLAIRAHLRGLQDLGECLEIHLREDVLPGYAWVFPTGEDTANVGVGIRLDGVTPGGEGARLRVAFERFIQSNRLAGGSLACQAQGFPIRTDFPAFPTSASGILIVGEAAGLVNPLTAEGIALALESGELAAEVAHRALCADDVSADFLGQYDEVLRQRHSDFFRDARELVARLAHPTVVHGVVKHFLTDKRFEEALATAVLRKQPRRAITSLEVLLSNQDDRSPVGPLFALGAYQPLLDHCRAVMLARVSTDTPTPLLLHMLARGKMLRALLVFLGYQAAGGDPKEVVAGAAGIELVHAASLIHDDIMDNAPMRRGLPALHVALGVPRAIVCGDYFIAKAFRLLAETRSITPPAHVVEAFIIGAESGVSTCVGQFQDVGPSAPETLDDEKAYDQLMAHKTASALAGALQAGAALAGGDETLLKMLGRYGDCVGRVFQIRDDIMDFAAVPDSNGGTDRRATLPLIHAFRHSDDRGRELIRRFYRDHEVNAAEMIGLLQATGSLVYAERVARSMVAESIRLAKAVPHVGGLLEAFACYAIAREC
jgi:menaquinone-9 beta-reductase